MDISPLDIKLVRQHPDSDDCLRSSAKMVFSFYKDPITKKEIWNKVHAYKKHSGLYGSYMVDLGKLALEKGYKPTIYLYGWNWWDEKTTKALKGGKRVFIKALQNLKRKKKEWKDKKIINKEVAFLKKGGSFKFEHPTLDIIDSYLQKNLPIIIAIRAEHLYRSPKENYPHSIVVVGKDTNDYLIKDPYLALEKVKQEELLYAWTRNGGRAISFTPKKGTPIISQEELKL